MSHMRQISGEWNLFRNNPLFECVSEEWLLTLYRKGESIRSFQQGAVLFDQASYMQSLAFLLAGSALVYKQAGNNKRILMNRLVPGDVFGMASLFCDEAYPVEILAEQPARVLFLTKPQLEEAFQAEPRLSRNYIALLSRRIQFLNRRIEVLTGEDIQERLIAVLRSLGTGEAFTLPYSLSQLAGMTGVGRASLYRALDQLEAQGVFARNGRHFTGFRRSKENRPE